MRWRTWSLPRLARYRWRLRGDELVSRPCLPRPWIAVPASRSPLSLPARAAGRRGPDRVDLVRRLEDSRWPLLHLRGEARFRYLDGHGQWHRDWPPSATGRYPSEAMALAAPEGACLSLSRSHCSGEGPPNMISDGARRHAAICPLVWLRSGRSGLVPGHHDPAGQCRCTLGRALAGCRKTGARCCFVSWRSMPCWRGSNGWWLPSAYRRGPERTGNAGAAPSKVDMDTSILPIGGELPLDGRGVAAWPMAGACAARSLRAPQSFRHRSRVLSRLLAGLGVPAEQVQVMVAQWFSYLSRRPLHDWVAPRKPATGPLRARPGAVRCAR